MIFKILDVYAQDNHLCVWVQHFRATGSEWFKEHYLFQGREGLKQKRATDAQGRILMDDGEVAPILIRKDGLTGSYLPTGRTWKRLPAPHMDDSSILVTIRSIHQQRTASGWIRGDNTLSNHKSTVEDELGNPVLLERFGHLKGYSE